MARALLVGAFLAVAFLAVAFLAMPARAGTYERITSLDGFLSTFSDCDPDAGEASGFSTFARSLGERFRNPYGEMGPSQVDEKVVVVLPKPLAFAVGLPHAVNQGEFTRVTVPMTGTFRGLDVAVAEFAFGNENGISVATLLFSAPRDDVVAQFGASIAKGGEKGKAASRDGAGYAAAIPAGEPGRIVCDWSN